MLGIAIVLAAVKLYLVAGQELIAINAPHDDYLYVKLARHIANGQWMGPYDQLTLIRGPVYPIWGALSYKLGIPLLLGEHLLYIGACAVFAWALAPVVRHRWILFVTYTVLLFNPSTFGLTRVIRHGIYESLTLLVLACVIGLGTRWDHGPRRLLGWSIALGLSLGAFWLTREEGVWLMPSILLILVWALALIWRCGGESRVKQTAVLTIPFLIWGIAMIGVCAVNFVQYGIFCTVELKTRAFQQAYGALLRVDHASYHPYVPLPQDTREQIYRVSPSFAELRPFWEGATGRAWGSYQRPLDGFPVQDPGEILGAALMWGLRDVVSEAGYHEDAKTAMHFYEQLATEVNDGCTGGLLPCGRARSGVLPPWRAAYTPVLWDSIRKGTARLLLIDELHLTGRSNAPEPILSAYRELTREPLAPGGDRELNMKSTPDDQRVTGRRIAVLGAVRQAYGIVLPWITFIACIALLVPMVCSKRNPWLLVVTVALWSAVMARLFLIAYVDIYTMAPHVPRLLSPAYAPLLPFCVLSIYLAVLLVLRIHPVPNHFETG